MDGCEIFQDKTANNDVHGGCAVVAGKTCDGLRYANVGLLGRDRRELLSNILHETHLAIN